MVYKPFQLLKPTTSISQLIQPLRYIVQRSVLTKPYYNFVEFKEREVELQKSVLERNLSQQVSVEEVNSKYKRYGKVQYEVNGLREKQNKLSLSMKEMSKEERVKLVEVAKRNKKELVNLETQLQSLQLEVMELASQLPNFTHPNTPVGGEGEAEVISINNKREQYKYNKDHLELALQNRMVNLKSAAKVSGNSFYYLTNSGALLELALINLAMERATQIGFQPILTPDLVKPEVVTRCGFAPRNPKLNQNFQVSSNLETNPGKPELNLVATAEIPMAAYHMDTLFQPHQLPDRYVAFGHSFRAEAGARGKETKGIYRVHQFSKVELFSFTTPQTSQNSLQEILNFQIDFFDALKLHFRVLNMPTQELGNSAYCKYDIEAYLPSQNKWGEISSTSNCTDYQSRRLNIRVAKPTNSNIKDNFVHTVNGTACAIPRTIVAILEQYQLEDGTIQIPEVLRGYFNGREVF